MSGLLRGLLAAARRSSTWTSSASSLPELALFPSELPAISLGRLAGAQWTDTRGYKDMVARKKKNERRLNNRASWQAVEPFLKTGDATAKAVPAPPKPQAIVSAIPPIPQPQEPPHYRKIGRVAAPFTVTPQAAFAIFELGPYQYRASPDDLIFNPKLKGVDVNDIISLDRVLLAGTRQQTLIGRPVLPGASVVAVVEEHFRDAKVEVFKMKPRKGYRKHQGHRAQLTALRILEIRGLDAAQAVALPEPSVAGSSSSSSNSKASSSAAASAGRKKPM